MKAKLIAVALLFTLTAAGSGDKPPTFDQFYVKPGLHESPVAPKLGTEFARKYSARIREAALRGPNFAGHFAVADWGCGMSCIQLAVVDLHDGSVYEGPFAYMSYGEAHVYEGGEGGITYRLNSRLLIARGCPADGHCGTYYYEWKVPKFRLIQYAPARPFRGSDER